ncbi:CLIP domain-containing serine protease B15-like [Dermacentor albipictus]|uniref:CLIP domain-containing serine protease B15-like n=1 Tax=Dermacentor albipictus TaxID=60249 RepID=UPI0031FDD6EC
MPIVWSRSNVCGDSNTRSTSKCWLILGFFLFLVDPMTGENKIDARLNRKSCGLSQATGRVFNGDPISRTQIPWIVQIDIHLRGTDTGSLCGGSIITRNVVMTAAHCIPHGFHPKKLYIYYNSTKRSAGPVNYVDRILTHPQYNQLKAVKYDIMLLKVRNYFRFDKFVRPICLPNRDIIVGNRSLLSGGWGVFNDQRTPVASKNLMYIHLYAFAQEMCEFLISLVRGVNSSGFDSKYALCLKGYKGNLCRGDSGAPITMRRKRGKSVQVAILSGGTSRCTHKFKFSITVRVYKFLSWIKEALRNSKSWKMI